MVGSLHLFLSPTDYTYNNLFNVSNTYNQDKSRSVNISKFFSIMAMEDGSKMKLSCYVLGSDKSQVISFFCHNTLQSTKCAPSCIAFVIRPKIKF